MKKLIALLIVAVVVLYSFKKGNINDAILFSGQIENPNSDSLNILNGNQEVVKTIFLNNDNNFRDTLYLSEGFYSLSDGKEMTYIYLKPQFDLSFSLNTKEFDESIEYRGKGANENNYLAKKALLEESFGKLNYYGYYAKLSEEAFLELTDSLYNVQVNLLENAEVLDNNFRFFESKSLEFRKLIKYSKYKSMKRFISGNNEFAVSKNYPKSFENVDLTNEELLISPDYLMYLQTYLRKETRDEMKLNKKTADYTLAYVRMVKKEVTNKVILEKLLYKVGKWDLNYTEVLDSVYTEIKPSLTDEKHLAEVTEKYNRLKKIEKGAISPTFELKDIHGKTVSLSDLKGKLVYIDIWATWCLPCLKEIPDLKKLEKHFKGKEIQFVSICKSDTKERWEKMVKEKELGGIQLFAPDENISFFTDYSVQGIPRFILIDQNGKILNGNARRPSDAALQAEIDGYL